MCSHRACYWSFSEYLRYIIIGCNPYGHDNPHLIDQLGLLLVGGAGDALQALKQVCGCWSQWKAQKVSIQQLS